MKKKKNEEKQVKSSEVNKLGDVLKSIVIQRSRKLMN